MSLQRSLLAVLMALALMTPAALVGAQGPPGDRGQPDQVPDDRGNQTAEDEGNESADDDGNERAEAGGNASDERRRGPPEDRGRDRGEQARQDAMERRSYRGFTVDNGTVDGRHVSFQVDNATISGYHLDKANLTVFDTIVLSGNASGHEAHGASFELETSGGELRILDTPNAVLLAEGEDNGSVQLTLADGITYNKTILTDDDEDEDEENESEGNETLEAEDNESEESEGNETLEAEDNESEESEGNETLEAEDEDEGEENETEDDPRVLYTLHLPGNRTAYLAGHGISDDNGTFTVTDRAQFRLQRPEAPGHDEDRDEGERGPPSFVEGRASRAQEIKGPDRAKIQQAIARGDVGIEVFADNHTGEPMAVELGHVQVRNARAFENGSDTKAEIEIEAEDGSPGTTIKLTLDRADLGNLTLAEAADTLGVRFDGANATPADDLDDVLDWRDDDGQAEYLLLVGAQEVEVLVSVPHFSPHTVEVYEVQSQDGQAVDSQPSSTPFPALVGLAAIAVAAIALAAIAVARRKD